MPATRTRSDARPAAADADTGSAAQQMRRKRILDATLALASKGGYEAVQMRAVAERAQVALGTLYRYFPSKIHLLLGALTEELERPQADPRGYARRPDGVRAVPGHPEPPAGADAHRGDDAGVHVRRPERGGRGEQHRRADGAHVHQGHSRGRAVRG